MRNKRVFLPLLLAVLLLVCLCPVRAAASEVGEIYKKSGAEGIYDSLDQETRALLSQIGVEQGEPLPSEEGEGLLQTLSQLLREKLAAPLKGMAALLSVVVLSRLAVVFEEGGDTVILAAALACAAVLTAPLLELIQAAEQVIDSACAFFGSRRAGLCRIDGSFWQRRGGRGLQCAGPGGGKLNPNSLLCRAAASSPRFFDAGACLPPLPVPV